ncbi:hypothetical protein TESS_TESS_01006 [Tessaracoccus sp. O5.2]|uniref:type IV toxin-antitoxin system AbiEi family antitoxin domain-containing protein n=1 Tax=Tessaracoccus sp. O5.2 TaxID=3157622 RepID=UPI0035E8E01A
MRIYHSLGAGGVATRRELLADGMSRYAITRAERDGELVRIDRCRYALPGAIPQVVTAAAADATLTCVSALDVHGIWTVPDAQLHLRRGGYSARRRELPAGAILCSSPAGGTRRPLDDVVSALLAAIRHHPEEHAVMAMDCILYRRLLNRAELAAQLEPVGLKGQALLSRADARTESALESLTRQRLRAAGFRPRPQFKLAGVGRFDFLLSDRLLIEADGREFHGTAESFESDRRRDRAAAALGYAVVRLTWRQVMSSWPAVVADLRAAMRRRRPAA